MIVEDLLRCSTSHGEFAIRSREVRHVARAEQMRPDDLDDSRIGVLKLGSQLVPVLSLDGALGLSPSPSSALPDHHIAVTGEGASLVGWLVNKLARESAIDVKLAPMPPAVGGHASRWFEGVVTCANGDLLLLIDPRELSPLRDHVFAGDRADLLFVPPAIAPAPAAEPVAVVFSTPVLPRSQVDKFALSGRQVVAIVQPAQTIPVPGCAPHVAGLTIWRDAVVPILDYRVATRDQSPTWRRLIARCGARSQSLIAFSIDDEVVMHRPAPDNRPIGDAECPPFASGVFDVNGDRVALLDLDALAKFEAGREN